MKIWKLLASRVNVIVFFLLLIIIQVAVFIVLTSLLAYHYPFVTVIFYVISFFAVLALIRKNDASAFKVKWIIIIMAFPVVGGVMYLILGNKRPTRKVAAIMQEHAKVATVLDCDSYHQNGQLVEDHRAAGLVHYIRQVSSYPAYENTQVKYYTMGEDVYEDMLAEMKAAQKFIFLEFFIIAKSQMWDSIVEVLIQKAAAGVDVRLIFDDLGSFKLFSKSYMTKLIAQGIKIVRFSPLVPFLMAFMNNRNHRKMVVIDGHTAFNGGINIADEYINIKKRLGVWKDTGVRLKGDGVWSFTLMFVETWDAFCKPAERIDDYLLYKSAPPPPPHSPQASQGLVLPYGDSPLDGEQLGENVYIEILSQAVNYVYIFTPYLIISEKMIHALQMAAKRGVDVRIVTPGIPDKKIVFRLTRANYSNLHEAGIKIYEYTPGFLHAKSFVSDDKFAVVGTINLDYRSLYLHFECATLLLGVPVIQDIKADALTTMAQSQEVFNKKRRFWGALLDAILHFFAPQM